MVQRASELAGADPEMSIDCSLMLKGWFNK